MSPIFRLMPRPSMWPKQFWSVQTGFGLTKMNWSGQMWFILVMTISFWLWPNHYGQVQINLVRPRPFWTVQNCFGHIEGRGISNLMLRLLLLFLQHETKTPNVKVNSRRKPSCRRRRHQAPAVKVQIIWEGRKNLTQSSLRFGPYLVTSKTLLKIAPIFCGLFRIY